MASINEVSSTAYTNNGYVPSITGANIRNVSRSGTSVYFEYQAYIYQSSVTWSSNSWALWVEGSKNTVFNSSSGSYHTSQNTKYYTGWYGKTVTLGASVSSTTVSVGVNGNSWNPGSPAGYVTLTVSGLPTISTPTLSNISTSSITDKSVYASFTVTANNGQAPYDPYIDVFKNSDCTGLAASIQSRGGTLSGLDANRTYYARGNDANAAGRSYTNVGSFTTTFSNPSAPGVPVLSYTGTEPILTSTLKASWIAASAGSTPVSGYRIRLYKNNAEVSTIDTDSTNTTYTFGTFDSLGFEVGDVAKVGIYAYSKDWNNNKHFNSDEASAAQVYSGTITVVSDKYIYASQNGGNFNKYKMYVSVNGNEFTEVKKEKFKVIK